MTAISAFRNEVYRDVKGALNKSVDEAVMWAALDFCRKTWLWDSLLAAQNIVADQPDYTVTPPSDSKIIAVDHVLVKNRRIDPTSEVRLNLSDTGWRDKTTTSPSSYFMKQDRVLTIVYTPDEAITGDDGLKVNVILEPDRTATVLEDFLYDDYLETIGYGAKFKLHAQRNMPYSSRQSSMDAGVEYRKGRNGAKSRRFFGYTGYQPKLKHKPFISESSNRGRRSRGKWVR